MRLITLAALVGSAHALDPYRLGEYSRKGISSLADLFLTGTGSRIALWQAQNAHSQTVPHISSQQAHFESSKSRDPWTTEPSKPAKYAEHCFEQPLDHMDLENEVTFCQRYWVSLEHYGGDKHGAEPVYVLDGGETSGANVSYLHYITGCDDSDLIV